MEGYKLARRWMPSLTVIVIICLAAIMMLADLRLKASILEIARSQAQLETVELINQAVNDKIVAQTDYRDIVYIHKDEKGKIVMLQTNTVILNQVMAKTVNEVIKSMKGLEGNTISVALGQVTGSIFLAAYGPKIHVKVIPVKQVNVEVENKFEQAGINQTRHLIYFKINSKIKIAVPFVDKDVDVSTTIPLADTIIVGDVPATYVNLSGPSQGIAPIPKSN
jgi:sporulation protein YunB